MKNKIFKYSKLIIISFLFVSGVYYTLNFIGFKRQSKIEAPLFDPKQNNQAQFNSLISKIDQKDNNLVQTNNAANNVFSNIINQDQDNQDGILKQSKDTNKNIIQASTSTNINIDPKLTADVQKYIVASSKLNFPKDQTLIAKSLEELKKGKSSSIDQIINSFIKGLDELKKIDYPKNIQEVVDYHNLSIKAVEDFVNLLKKIKDARGINVDLANDISNLQKNITQAANILSVLVTKYNLKLDASMFQ